MSAVLELRLGWSRMRSLAAELAAVGLFLLLALAGAAQAMGQAAKRQPLQAMGQAAKRQPLQARPNIVLIQADDATRGDVRFMPNVQRLLKRGGVSFPQYVVPYPLCGPARAALLTGQLSHNNRVLSNFRSNDGGHETLAHLPGRLNQRNTLGPWLRRAGYRTGLVGKYLNEYGGQDPTYVPPGWDRWAALVDNSTYDYFNYAVNVDGKLRFFGDRSYAEAQIRLSTISMNDPPTSFPELLATFREAFQPFDYFGTQDESVYTMDVGGDYAARFVRSAAPARRPFFLYYTPPGPHAEDTNHMQGVRAGAPEPDPRPPARYRDSFDHVPLPRPPSFNEADVSDKAANVRDLPQLTEAQIAEIQDNYRGRLGALRAVDDQVGKIARELRRAGELDDTFIVFTSDNGYMQGEHRLRASKFLPYENSIRVPALMAGPGIREGAGIRGAAMDVDLTSTILDMAGARPGRTMDGISLLPAARGKRKLPRRDVPLAAHRPLFKFTTPLTAFDVPYYGVRTGRHKYVHWSFGETELYDLKRDPDELVNLAADPDHAGTVARLEAKALRLTRCRGDGCR